MTEEKEARKGLSKAGMDRIVAISLLVIASVSVALVAFIIFFLVGEGLPIFWEVGPIDFIFGAKWYPSKDLYGALPVIAGTLLVTLGAMAISIPLGIASAVFLAEMAPSRVKSTMKFVIELLSGIPSVVYGFFGLVLLSDWLRVTFDEPTGQCWLAGSILLGIMALPTIISVSDDALRSVPREYREASLAMGATKWQTIRKVILPAALSGITAAVILGIGRAVGETMAVMMVTGNVAVIPDPLYDLFSPIRTITGSLALEMGEVATGSSHYYALFGLAIILLLMVLVINFIANRVLAHVNERFNPKRRKERKTLIPTDVRQGITTATHALAALVVATMSVWLIGDWFGTVASSIVAVAAIIGVTAFSHRRGGRGARGVSRTVMTVSMVLVGASLPILWSDWVTGLSIIAAIGITLAALRWLPVRGQQRLAFGLIIASVALVLMVLAIIIGYIVINGAPAISWDFLTQFPKDLGREGGIYPAIMGTVYLIVGAVLVSVPLGVLSGVYLAEYAKDTKATKVVRSAIDILNGTPSIVFGLFGFTFLVLFMGFGVSMLAGQLTLAFLVLPIIIRTTEEAVKAVPQSVREGSLAVGASKWQTIYRVVLPPALPGIITGIVLSIGRTAGETAPILFTAAVAKTNSLPDSVFDPVMALPYHLYTLATAVPNSHDAQFGTAFVLLVMVTCIYGVASLFRSRAKKKMR